MADDNQPAPLEAIFLPGLHGSDALISELVDCLNLNATKVTYPTDIRQSYKKLYQWLDIQYDFNEPKVIFAESFSTVLALRLADAYPKSVQAVVIAGGFCNSPKHPLFSLLPLRPLFMLSPPRSAVRHFLVGSDASAEQVEHVRQILKKVSSKTLSQRLRSVLTLEEETVPSIPKTPVLLLNAQDDVLIPWEIQNQLENHLPHAESHWIDCAHFLFYTQPEKCAECITEFLQQLGLLD